MQKKSRFAILILMETINELYSPKELFAKLPLLEREAKQVRRYRQIARAIFTGQDPRVAVIVGPCSIHSIAGALEYAEKLKSLFYEIADTIFPIMRVYVEKPRTTIGWKGLLYDPQLDGKGDILSGIKLSRELFLQLARLGIPTATEFVNPLTAIYFKDLITWGFIGARTTASQIHREFASCQPFPIGFKNDLNGNLQISINSILSARVSHSFLSLNTDGKLGVLSSRGNRFTHLVLRGSDQASNYDQQSISYASYLQKKNGIDNKIMIDCAHGNSQKNSAAQKEVFFDVAARIATENLQVMGIMLESYLEEGSQSFTTREPLSPRLSVTDPCISWDDTETLLRWLNNTLKQRGLALSIL